MITLVALSLVTLNLVVYQTKYFLMLKHQSGQRWNIGANWARPEGSRLLRRGWEGTRAPGARKTQEPKRSEGGGGGGLGIPRRCKTK